MNTPQIPRSPVFEAQQAARYDRQSQIRTYEEQHGCRLVVLLGKILPYVPLFMEEVLYNANPEQDLHMILDTQGGDGETALRLIRQAQSRCKEFTVIVPDQAKSAGTLIALGADHIYMGPTSDLGPIDPQIVVDAAKPDDLYPARSIINAVGEAEKRVQSNPQTYPLHAALLGDITALIVQRARDGIARADDQLEEALGCASRDPETVKELVAKLRDPLIKEPRIHAMTVSTELAKGFGLPVREFNPSESQWREIWRLWVKYRVANIVFAVEGQFASQIIYR